MVLGVNARVDSDFAYRSFTFYGRAFQPFPLSSSVPLSHAPQPRAHCCTRFGLFQVRSPLLPESLVCFLFLRVLRCFNSPRLPYCTYVFSTEYHIAVVGFPIRIPPDQSSFGSSPRLVAAVRVLHRFSIPRHPPCALTSLLKQSPYSSSLFLFLRTMKFSKIHYLSSHGGREEDRTPDPQNANLVLYQLS